MKNRERLDRFKIMTLKFNIIGTVLTLMRYKRCQIYRVEHVSYTKTVYLKVVWHYWKNTTIA